MRKKFKLILTFILITFSISCLFACSKSEMLSAEKGSSGAQPSESYTDVELSGASKTAEILSNRKIVTTVRITAETKEFDGLLRSIEEKVTALGGYMASSDISGNATYTGRMRSASLTVRIPSGSAEDFSGFVSESSTVTNRATSTEDVTDSYLDMEARISALETKRQTLENLLSGAATVSDTLTVYDKLTDVISEIESIRSRLNAYDSQIEYTSVSLHIFEVERESVAQEAGFMEKTWHDLQANFSDIGNGIADFASFFISALPYWLILAVCVFAAVAITKSLRKKRRNKKTPKEKS